MEPRIQAIEYIRRMRGGSQPHLLRCSDGYYYVAKSPSNPQGLRTLANELLGSRLAALLGLPVAIGKVLLVEADFIRLSTEMVIEFRHGRTTCQAGLWFGSRYPFMPGNCGAVYDWLPLDKIANPADFLGMLVFDKWTGNMDRRQIVLFREEEQGPCRSMMIDQGWCFDGPSWTFADGPLVGRYPDVKVYAGVKGIDAFDPWLSRLESEIDKNALLEAAQDIPPDWYDENSDALMRLIGTLERRRKRVRDLLWSAQKFSDLFPNWSDQRRWERIPPSERALETPLKA